MISNKDAYAGGAACQGWLPAGEVFVTPVPGTAKGTFVTDDFFFEGKRIERLTLDIEPRPRGHRSTGNALVPRVEVHPAQPRGHRCGGADVVPRHTLGPRRCFFRLRSFRQMQTGSFPLVDAR